MNTVFGTCVIQWFFLSEKFCQGMLHDAGTVVYVRVYVLCCESGDKSGESS